MAVELKVPAVGESITEVVVGAWRKSIGDTVERDEDIVELETDKATVDVPAPEAGVITKIIKAAGETAAVGEIIGYIGNADESPQTAAPKPPAARAAPQQASAETTTRKVEVAAKPQAKPAPKADGADNSRDRPVAAEAAVAPAASASMLSSGREERVVPMTPIRRRIAQRLVEAQQTAALLTTFNEIDMSAVVELRQKYRDSFREAYGVKLGFMSFFVKAVVEALAAVPQVNAEVRGSDLVFRNYFDIGIAVGSGKGLVVPVLRNAERMSFAEIERAIADFSHRAGENRLKVEELQGGTFTISNGGVYGSLLSTPLVNPPQSGVLGMHAIQDRPVVREGAVVIRPMMYVALTYDHRVVDGREAVAFLLRVREIVEDPARLLIEI